MDDLGNIVYVLAVVGYMIYKVFAGKKQPKKAKPDNKRPSTTIEDILREITEKKEPATVAPPNKERPSDHKGHVHDAKPFLSVDSPKTGSGEYRMSESETISHKRSQPKVRRTEKQLDIYENEAPEILPDGVDLRKAIIYQTILETPYLRHV